MIEISLTIIILALLVFIYLSSYHMNQERKEWSQEREKLMKMFLAKDLNEITANEALGKETALDIQLPSDTVDLSEEDEDVFDQAIKAQLRGDNEHIPPTIESE